MPKGPISIDLERRTGRSTKKDGTTGERRNYDKFYWRQGRIQQWGGGLKPPLPIPK